eukprot:5622019-Alexandrium_andersonii.AAC.1
MGQWAIFNECGPLASMRHKQHCPMLKECGAAAVLAKPLLGCKPEGGIQRVLSGHSGDVGEQPCCRQAVGQDRS